MRRARTPRGRRALPRTRRPNFVVDFCSSTEGLQLNRAFVKIADAKVRRRIIELVKALAADEPTTEPAHHVGRAAWPLVGSRCLMRHASPGLSTRLTSMRCRLR